MLSDINRVIWNQEFKRFKALAVREQLRREYDVAISALNAVTPQAAADEKNEKLQDQKKQVEERVNMLKGQIDDMDYRINGALPSEDREGAIGITQELESSIEMREYIKAFVKHNV